MPERRRGQRLEDALLDAAWLELTEHGYAALTMEAVAQRAGTSRPVLARRWPDRSSLLRATLAHYLSLHPVATPDTGSLREDLISALHTVNDTGAAFIATVSVHLGAYYEETGTSPGDLRDAVIGGDPDTFGPIFSRGIDRGEIDPARLTTRIKAVPFDLMRQELISHLGPAPDRTIREIVDDVFIPLVEPHGRRQGRSPRR